MNEHLAVGRAATDLVSWFTQEKTSAVALETAALVVRDLVEVELEPHQFCALVSLASDVGREKFAESTVLERVNERRFEDAASAFGNLLYVQEGKRQRADLDKLVRRYAEACLMMAKDFRQTCSATAIGMKAEPARGGVGLDTVKLVTPFQHILRLAENHPLPEFYANWRDAEGVWDEERWPDFRPYEFACKCNGRFCDGSYFHDPFFLDKLQSMRSMVGEEFIITSGHRCPEWNVRVGGSSTSMHQTIAADIALAGHNLAALYAKAAWVGFNGLGFGGSFLHVDARPVAGKWGYGSASCATWEPCGIQFTANGQGVLRVPDAPEPDPEVFEDPEEYSRVAGEGEVPIALSPSSVPEAAPPAMTPSVAGGLPYAATPPINGAGSKPPSVYTVPPDKVPYKVDPKAGAKPLEDSDRVKGYVNQEFGKAIIRVGALGGFGSGAAGMLQTLEKDPVLMGVYLTLFTSLGALAIGKGIELYGDWKRKRGEEAASQLLF